MSWTAPLPTASPRAAAGRRRPWSSTTVLLAIVGALALAIVGVAAGIEVDVLVHGPSARAEALANATAPYVAVAGLLAMLHRSPLRAAMSSAALFAAFVAGYYLSYARHVGIAAVNHHYAGVWLLIAVGVCPVLTGALTWARRRRGVLRAIVFAMPASGALAEALLGRTWGMAGVLATCVIACNLLVAAAFVVVVPRGVVTKVAAAAWATPCTIAVVLVVQHLGRTGAYFHWMYGQ